MAQNYPNWPKNGIRIYALFPQIFLTEKAVPQTFSLLECMPPPPLPEHSLVLISFCRPSTAQPIKLYWSHHCWNQTPGSSPGSIEQLINGSIEHVSIISFKRNGEKGKFYRMSDCKQISSDKAQCCNFIFISYETLVLLIKHHMVKTLYYATCYMAVNIVSIGPDNGRHSSQGHWTWAALVVFRWKATDMSHNCPMQRVTIID